MISEKGSYILDREEVWNIPKTQFSL